MSPMLYVALAAATAQALVMNHAYMHSHLHHSLLRDTWRREDTPALRPNLHAVLVETHSKPAGRLDSRALPTSSAQGSSTTNAVGGGNTEIAFLDGQLACSQFPSAYGAVPLDHLGLGGWSGLQQVTWHETTITNLVTGVAGDTCHDGMMCSYACPPGFQKSQWPSVQGAAGQSVGGLECKDGQLHLTNPTLSSNLCIRGRGGVQARNSASEVVSICRTDYPGTESQTIPVQISPNEVSELANPDAATYYRWQGKATSAQYYLNPIGVAQDAACQWGTAGTDRGNFAPINLGVGYSDGTTWLSIFQNAPTTAALYEGTVELQGDLSAVCKYVNGSYCGATGCNSNGCTVAVNSGVATFVIAEADH